MIAVACTSAYERLTSGDIEELLTFLRQTAEGLGAEARWLGLGRPPLDMRAFARSYGIGRVEVLNPDHEDAGLDASVELLARYCRSASPFVLVFASSWWSRIVAARVAVRLQVPVLVNVQSVERDEDGSTLRARALAFGGSLTADYRLRGGPPYLLLTAPTATIPQAAPLPSEPEYQEVHIPLDGTGERARRIQVAETSGPRLDEAQVIVAGGRGLGSPDNYPLIQELARLLGGVPAASRPLVDAGWVDASHQVGLTGKVVKPLLYIAVGISGASQHMAGCSGARTIVAINKDSGAPIFRYAKYGVVGDAVELLDALIRRLKEAKREAG